MDQGDATAFAFAFDKYTLDLRRGCLRDRDHEIALRPKCYELLRYLAGNAGRLVSKKELLDTVWPGVTVTDESLTRCVSDVRAAVRDTDQRIIKTVPRRGYVFSVPVSSSPISAAEVSTAPDLGDRNTRVPRLSLVVLPFVNLSGDLAQDYVADALTDGLTTYLSRIGDSFVIARSTAFTYKGKPVDIRTVGRELGVRYVLEGSEQHTDRNVRVVARLIDVETGAQLWADQLDAGRSDLLEMQDNIVTHLTRALQIELATVEAAQIFRARPTSADAEELALRGQAIFLRCGPTHDGVGAGYELCERALTIDPVNVRALCILSEKFITWVAVMQSVDRNADIEAADQLVTRALATDPNFYHAHHVKGRILLARRQPEASVAEAERCLALNPSFVPAILNLCAADLLMGRPDASLECANRAIRLSPRDPYIGVFHAHKAYASVMLHDDDHAIDYLRRAIAVNPELPTPYAWLAAMLALRNQQGEAGSVLKLYLNHPETKTTTIAQMKAVSQSRYVGYLAFRERLYEGLRKLGIREA